MRNPKILRLKHLLWKKHHPNLKEIENRLIGYGKWLTEWYAYNQKMLNYLGGREGIDRISGFIYVGHKKCQMRKRLYTYI